MTITGEQVYIQGTNHFESKLLLQTSFSKTLTHAELNFIEGFLKGRLKEDE